MNRRLLLVCASLLVAPLCAGACIGDGCSGKLMGENAAKRMAVRFFKHALPAKTELLRRDVAAGPTVYGVRANAGKCVIGARQTVASALSRDELVEHYKRAYFKPLMRRLPRGLPVVVKAAGKAKDGRTRYTLTITDCCRDFGSICKGDK